MRGRAAGRERRAFLLFAAAVLVLLLPVLAVALYNRPSADDFGYSMSTHAALVRYGADPAQLLGAAAETDLQYYNTWQGLYVSAFLLSLQPAIFGEGWYALTTPLVLAILFLGLWGMFALVLHGPARRPYLAPALALLFLYAFVEGMPSPVEGLYWFNGAMNYLPFLALSLLNIGVLLRLVQGRGHPAAWALLGCLLGVVISGGHQVAALFNLMMTLLALVLAAPRRRFWPLLPLAAGAAGLLFNLLSPGTAVRYAGFSPATMPEAVAKSFLLAALSLVRWLDVPLLALLALLTPVFLHLAQSGGLPRLLCRRPWLAPAWTFLLVWGLLWLPSYTMGGIGPGRLINVVWIVFVLGCAVSWASLLGWQTARGLPAGKLVGAAAKRPKAAALTGMALLLCMACIGSHTVKEGLDNHFGTSLEAVWELAVEGSPQAYAAELDARTAALKDPAEAEATIYPLSEDARPYLLYFSDVTPGPDTWGLAEYYGKTAVTVADPDGAESPNNP